MRFVNQCELLPFDAWDKLTGRVSERASTMPIAQLVGDCNPSIPNHWIRQQAKELKVMDWKPIENSEFDDILDLLDVSFPICREIIDQDLQEVIDDPTPHGKIYRLKVDGNQIVGTAIYGRLYGTPKGNPGDVWEGEGILRYLAIHPDHRRKGYATWIINKVMSDLKDVGCPCLCISLWRKPADDVYRNLYKRFGFEYYDSSISERYGEYYGEQDYYVYWFPTGEENKK